MKANKFQPKKSGYITTKSGQTKKVIRKSGGCSSCGKKRNG